MQDLPRCRARAAELFDWLRQLPETHELAHLCDVYTYTTAISHVRTPNTVQYCTSKLCKWRACVQAKYRALVQAHHQWQSVCCLRSGAPALLNQEAAGACGGDASAYTDAAARRSVARTSSCARRWR